MHEQRYSRILSEIVGDYQLAKEPIIQFNDIPDPMKAGAIYFNSGIIRLVITTNPNMFLGADDDIILGGLAHELVHLENFSRMTHFDYYIHFLSLLSREYEKTNERNTDLGVILKGRRHGICLLKNREYRYKTAPKERFERMRSFYLSPDEIKQEIQRRWQ